MKANQSPSFDNHELVSFTEDSSSGLKAIIAVHNTHLGAAVGGCRMYPYVSDSAALEDVLRLSRGMTYKSALAGLPMGGGKAVIIGDHRSQKTPELLRAMGRFIDSHKGKYITAEDSGTCVADMKIMGEQTQYVSGVSDAQNFGGDPSPFTALGIFHGIKAAVKHRNSSSDLQGARVAIQGAGAVGYYLAKLLIGDGAEVLVADVNAENLSRTQALGAKAIAVEDVLSAQVDVLAPCAMGAIINDQTINQLNTPIIAGGANNQLAEARHADMLNEMGILYAPDFVINAGGIIEIHHQNQMSSDGSQRQVERIGETLSKIFSLSEAQNLSTAKVAEQMAESIFKPNKNSSVSDAA
jgi:leucine dehydrogenase